MLPTRLNLLPHNKKKVLEQIIFFQFLKGILELAILIATITSIALVGGAWVLQDHYKELNKITLASSSKYDEVDERMNELNQIILNAKKIQDQYIMWTPILAEFTTVLPPNIALQTLNLDMREKRAIFTGVAPKREDLLVIQEYVNKHSLIGETSIPPSSLTLKQNIPFLISTKLNK